MEHAAQVDLDSDLARDDAITDDELAALALAADPTERLDEDAVPFSSPDDPVGVALLPAWYMPVPASFGRTRKRKIVISLIIG